ncbi:MAG: hypothetical protein HQK96_09470 [Nitrospirae bacterium]|nr:hypothetical protein [Nitrospirota bacterium]
MKLEENISGKEILIKAEKALRGVLEKVPFINILSIELGKQLCKDNQNLFVNLIIDGNKKQTLSVEVKSNGQPRMASYGVNQLLRFL